eukprot:9704681-Ditylum_brightwellii.AAC.1
MAMPFLAAFTPSRWEKAMDCMLEKDVGVPKFEHLCIIVIVEDDMDAALKLIWNRCLVSNAEKTNF